MLYCRQWGFKPKVPILKPKTLNPTSLNVCHADSQYAPHPQPSTMQRSPLHQQGAQDGGPEEGDQQPQTDPHGQVALRRLLGAEGFDGEKGLGPGAHAGGPGQGDVVAGFWLQVLQAERCFRCVQIAALYVNGNDRMILVFFVPSVSKTCGRVSKVIFIKWCNLVYSDDLYPWQRQQFMHDS